MKIFIDFDDVIFNTKEFRMGLEDLFNANGINKENFRKYYNDPQDQRAIKVFSPWLLVERASKDLALDIKKINVAVGDFISDISEYVFEDFGQFIDYAGDENIYVVSYGDPEFQDQKITGSRIKTHLKNIFITGFLKAESIKKIIEDKKWNKNEKIFFIDDRIEQLEDVKQAFPRIVTILMKRPEGRYCNQLKNKFCDCEVHDLKEAEEIIEKLNFND